MTIFYIFIINPHILIFLINLLFDLENDKYPECSLGLLQESKKLKSKTKKTEIFSSNLDTFVVSTPICLKSKKKKACFKINISCTITMKYA